MTECQVSLRVSSEDWETMLSILRGWYRNGEPVVDVDEVAQFEEIGERNNERFVSILLGLGQVNEMYEKFKDKIEYQVIREWCDNGY